MGKNYFTDEQMEAIYTESIQVESDSYEGQFTLTQNQLKALMNLAVETAIGEPYLHVDYSKMQNVNWIKVNNLKDNTPLYSVKELEN